MNLIRSWMFVPGHRQKMIDKALGLNADAIMLDIEDGVAPTMTGEPDDHLTRLHHLAGLGSYAGHDTLRIGLELGKIDLIVGRFELRLARVELGFRRPHVTLSLIEIRARRPALRKKRFLSLKMVADLREFGLRGRDVRFCRGQSV